MERISLILLAFGFVSFCFAARGVNPPPWQLGWIGLAFWILAEILFGAQHAFSH